jgi:formylglycine-generating enzyme required for sulfatase activity
MVVIPAGQFIMGSPPDEPGRYVNESPQHLVKIAAAFAVSKFDVTVANWNTCAAVGTCPNVSDGGFPGGRLPVINVSYDEAKHYAAWLGEMTGKHYRLLTEAEWEYAARAGTTSIYYWGDEIGANNADCIHCGSQWDGKGPAPVGSFSPNKFGLYDMAGNVWQWVEDCYHSSYDKAPSDGSAWMTGGNCSSRMARSGAWDYSPARLRSADRDGYAPSTKVFYLGFRIARALGP